MCRLWDAWENNVNAEGPESTFFFGKKRGSFWSRDSASSSRRHNFVPRVVICAVWRPSSAVFGSIPPPPPHLSPCITVFLIGRVAFRAAATRSWLWRERHRRSRPSINPCPLMPNRRACRMRVGDYGVLCWQDAKILLMVRLADFVG